jgi:hypothetical protein
MVVAGPVLAEDILNADCNILRDRIEVAVEAVDDPNTCGATERLKYRKEFVHFWERIIDQQLEYSFYFQRKTEGPTPGYSHIASDPACAVVRDRFDEYVAQFEEDCDVDVFE